MKFLRLLFSLALLVFAGLFSCKENENEKLLPGKWSGVEWLIDGQPSTYAVTSTSFEFLPDGSYQYRYQDRIEKGSFYLSGNELYTTPEGGVKMMVKLRKLTADSLIFDMNRGGQAESLTLVRQH